MWLLFLFILVVLYLYYDNYGNPFTTIEEDTPEPYEPPINHKFMSREDKLAYMQSSEWLALKHVRLTIDNNQCVHCHSTTNLHLHHITYARLGVEKISDVCILCSTCHNNLHKITGYDRLSYHHPKRLNSTPKFS